MLYINIIFFLLIWFFFFFVDVILVFREYLLWDLDNTYLNNCVNNQVNIKLINQTQSFSHFLWEIKFEKQNKIIKTKKNKTKKRSSISIQPKKSSEKERIFKMIFKIIHLINRKEIVQQWFAFCFLMFFILFVCL